MTTAIVTGAAGGIGKAIADELAAAGLRVVGVDTAEGAVLRLDLTAPDTPDLVIDHAPAASVLVHCAFAEERATLLDGTEEGWDRTFAVSLHAVVRLSRAFVRALDGRPGAIVSVGSVHGFAGVPGYGAYAAAKAGLQSFTRSAAVEWGPLGVRVNAVAPGFVAVDRNRHIWQDPDQLGRLSATYPLRRVADPTEIARAVTFLAGDGASFITGVTLPVDGGLLARLPEVER
ncbi:SDR family NAD(P)-dependent oxidoreductase [Actinokineospora sp. HUAS TT18]|uniref:SDR family NAD(P)-dependent oxidoreductase n=1 Tax=Actinokineospora sp. HUAS TT18 TaxID=3447451 RepID=UPI003F51CB0A